MDLSNNLGLRIGHGFRQVLIDRSEDRSKGEVWNRYDFKLGSRKTGESSLYVFHPEREIHIESFHPLSKARDLRKIGFGTLAHGLLLSGIVFTEFVKEDYVVRYDRELLYCVGSSLKSMNLKDGLELGDYLSQHREYARKKGISMPELFN